MPQTNALDLPKGFLVSTVEAAIKKPGKKDLALIFSEEEAVMAGLFTMNRVKAAPVKLDMSRISRGRGQAIIVNSGNANACTGRQGMRDAEAMARFAAKGLHLDDTLVYVCSTGVIGSPMPMERIRKGMGELIAGLGTASVQDVARAIMTTDTFPKAISKKLMLGNKKATIVGICKGAGMICPNMATMLCFILTDASITRAALDAALRDAVQTSFNRITIDGDMSTNDTVLAMANGASGSRVIQKGSVMSRRFSSVLAEITAALSGMIAQDGEGATKRVEVVLKNARTAAEAEKGAFTVANSLLVKTALYGNDANWGRIMAALGRAGIMINEARTSISFGKVRVVSRGITTGRDAEAAEELRKKTVTITVDLNIGKGSAKVLTCDLTEEYVRVNADYRT